MGWIPKVGLPDDLKLAFKDFLVLSKAKNNEYESAG
jgi:hypothetical protein